MKRLFRLIAGGMLCVSISSCSVGYDYAVSDQIQIQGTVTDTEGNPINHIKITFGYGEGTEHITVYTSLKGEFIADIEAAASVITVKLEDIDGEDNGGLFESITDQITILEDDILKEDTITLDYRLSRATASESSPQSW
jgi:putative lipoprotein (rSAM/lipoprotein system)